MGVGQHITQAGIGLGDLGERPAVLGQGTGVGVLSVLHRVADAFVGGGGHELVAFLVEVLVLQIGEFRWRASAPLSA